MIPLVIYHSHCTDGFGAAFAAWMKFGDDAEYLPISYGDTKTHLEYTGREVYILDFSFPLEVMQHIVANAKRLVWLDHHKTAFEMWPGAEEWKNSWFEDTLPNDGYILLDNDRSGAMLAWQYFHPDVEIPQVIKHIDDRDRWQFKIPGSKELHAALQMQQPWSFKNWEALFIIDETPHAAAFVAMKYRELLVEGGAVLRAQEQRVDNQANEANICMLRPMFSDCFREGLMLNSRTDISEVGHALANRSGTYGLVWFINAEGKAKCSLRSNGDYDVSEIAKTFGGGGHKNAAGFETDITTLMSWMR